MRKNITGPLEIRGVTYKTSAAAARALGVSSQVVSKARRNGTLQNVALGIPSNLDGSSNRRETVILGVTYASRTDAALALDITATQLSIFLGVASHLNLDVSKETANV